jgi:hypothetical protein
MKAGFSRTHVRARPRRWKRFAIGALLACAHLLAAVILFVAAETVLEGASGCSWGAHFSVPVGALATGVLDQQLWPVFVEHFPSVRRAIHLLDSLFCECVAGAAPAIIS